MSFSDQPSSSADAPERLGPYRLEEVLGEGGAGIVRRAVRDDGLVVALKLLRPALAADETYRRRFEREARAAAEVSHPHLVPVLDAGELDGQPYIASAYIEGETLAARIARSPEGLPAAEAVHLLAGLAAGLDALHAAGLVHRDVKPSNALIDRSGSALLTDFGLARGRAHTVLTRVGQVLGTLDYLSPEVIRGEPATAASDLYGLGCVAYECLAGHPQFAGKSLVALGVAHLEEEPAAPCRGSLGWATLQALAKDAGQRPSTARAYATMLSVAAREVHA